MRIQKMLAACCALSAVAVLALPAAAQYRSNNHGGDNRGAGGAVAAGALGFVLGAAIADSQQNRYYARQHMSDSGWVNSCRSRYHSYDRGSGTFLGRDGNRRYCH
jgi:hypothetical protein